jgi:hypothetical protein
LRGSFAQAGVTRDAERCWKLLLGNGCEGHIRLEKGMAGVVVICELWKLAVVL